jgi:hypothetical protein
MEEGEKKPDAGTISGIPQKKIVYAIIAIAVVILAVVLIAKFGYNTDLLNPAGGQMSLVQRPPRTVITMIPPAVQPITVRPITSVIVHLSPCVVNQSTDCNGLCEYLMTDWNNCGTCGFVCGAHLCNFTKNNVTTIKNCDSCNHGTCIFDDTCEGVVCAGGDSCCKGRCVPNNLPNCG